MLLVEDAEEDVFFIRRALGKLGFLGTFRHVDSITAALAYLRHSPPFENRAENPAPDLIISDNGLHSGSGLDVIREVRGKPEYAHVPIILYTGGLSPAAASLAQEAGATACITKALDMTAVAEQLRRILEHLPEHCQWWRR